MTELEAREKSAEKVKQIQDLAKKLQVRILAHQAITQGNIIKSVVYFSDEEEYDVPAPAPAVTRIPLPGGDSMPTHISKLEQENKDETNTNTDLPK